MKVKEILEMTLTKPVVEIAKDHLTIGEKKLRESLKAIGCEHQSGKKGWTYEGDPDVLEKSIYDFAPVKRKATAIKRSKGERRNEPTNHPTVYQDMIIRKRSSFDIDVELMQELKLQALLHNKPIYLIVEDAIREAVLQLKKGD